jgi:hypothetical protein
VIAHVKQDSMQIADKALIEEERASMPPQCVLWSVEKEEYIKPG